jgi:hypothetical protein
MRKLIDVASSGSVDDWCLRLTYSACLLQSCCSALHVTPRLLLCVLQPFLHVSISRAQHSHCAFGIRADWLHRIHVAPPHGLHASVAVNWWRLFIITVSTQASHCTAQSKRKSSGLHRSDRVARYLPLFHRLP